jgi:hypothetical protein
MRVAGFNAPVYIPELATKSLALENVAIHVRLGAVPTVA